MPARPTPREWRRLWEPLAWLFCLPVIAKTLGLDVALIVAGAGLAVHGVAWVRSVMPGDPDDESETDPPTVLESVVAHMAGFLRRRHDLGRLLAMASVLTALALERRLGRLVYVLPVLVVAVLTATAVTEPPRRDRRDRREDEPADPTA